MALYDEELDYDDDIEFDEEEESPDSESLGTKSFDDIVQYTIDSIIQKDIGLTNVNAGSVLRTLIEVLAENEDTQNYYMEYIYQCMNIDNCVGSDLDRSAVIFGITRDSATPAVGLVTFYTGDYPTEVDIDIPDGYIVSTLPNANGEITEFSVVGNNVIEAGSYSKTIQVSCLTPGRIYIPSGSISVMSSYLSGVASVSNGAHIDGGEDEETDDNFRDRIKSIKTTFGKCTDDAISKAVNDVEGVSAVRVIDMYNGVGTTGVIVTTDVIPAPLEIQNNVSAAVADAKASGILAVIVYTAIKTIEIDITINDIDQSTYQDVVTTINNYCKSLVAGQSFIVKQMERKVLNVIDTNPDDNDSIDIVTNKPTGNVTSTNEQTIRASKITINGDVVYTLEV